MEKERAKTSLEKICDKALLVVKKYISKQPETIIDIEDTKEGWRITVEALERKAVPDTQDILGRYEIRLDKNGELIGWKQKIIRRRSDRIGEIVEEPDLTP